MTLFNNPIPKNAAKTPKLFGGRSPMTNAMLHNAMAAIPTLSKTIVSGGRSATAIPTKKNDPPHRMDRATNITHSRAPIDVFIVDIIVSTCPKFIHVVSSLASDQNSKHPIIAL